MADCKNVDIGHKNYIKKTVKIVDNLIYYLSDV